MQNILFQRQKNYFKVTSVIVLIPNQNRSVSFLCNQKYVVTVTKWTEDAMQQERLSRLFLLSLLTPPSLVHKGS